MSVPTQGMAAISLGSHRDNTPTETTAYQGAVYAHNAVVELRRRVEGLVDRLAGPVPENEASAPSASAPSGLFPELRFIADQIHTETRSANIALNRLEEALP